MTRIASRSMEEVPCNFSRSFVKFEGHMGQKIGDFDPISAFPDDCFQGLPIQFQRSRSYRPFTKSLGRPHLSNPSDVPCLQFNAILCIVIYCHVLYSTSLLP